jgi:hypothetical protein
LPFFFCLGPAGCRSHCDLVEAELRTRDRELYDLRDELHRLRSCNDGLQREIRALRRHSPAKVAPEDAGLIFSLKAVTLGRQTGGYNDDDCPGDEALQVVLEPRDVDNHLIKAPGTLEVRALEVNAEGLKRPLCSWQLSNDELRRTWKSGLLSTGYFVLLPWKAYPTSEKLRVVVLFTLADGRCFEADKDVSVRLIPVSRRKPLPPPTPESAPPTRTPELAPSPRRVDPPAAEQISSWRGAPAPGLSSAVQILPPRPRQ